MGKIIEKYQILTGLVLGAFIFALIFSGTVYFLGVKNKLVSPAYAAAFPGSKAVVAAFPCSGGFILIGADKSVTTVDTAYASQLSANYFANLTTCLTNALGNTVTATYQSGLKQVYVKGNGAEFGRADVYPPAISFPSSSVAQGDDWSHLIYWDGTKYQHEYKGTGGAGTVDYRYWVPSNWN